MLAWARTMRTLGWSVVTVLAAVGCGASGTKAQETGGDATTQTLRFPDAGSHAKEAGPAAFHDTGVDSAPAGPSCSALDASSTQPCGTLSFITSPSTSRPRNHHVTLTFPIQGATMLFAIGGANDEAPINNVDRVPIMADGSLGTWVADEALPFNVGGLVGEIVSGVLVTGGGTLLTGNATATTFSSVLNSDGSLAGWKAAPPFNEARMHAGSIARGNVMWVAGGFSGGSIWSDIISTTVSSDGTVSAWQPAGQLPSTLSHFTMSLVGDDIYLTGGLEQSAGNDNNPPDVANTWLGQIQSDGTLGGWVAQTPLPAAEAAHAAFVYGGYLNVCGGINNGPAEEDRCWKAPIQADRSLGEWEEIASLPLARGHVHQMPIVGSQVYSIAGAIDFNLDSTTDVFIGSWDTKMGGKRVEPRAVRPITPGPVPTHGAKCHLHHSGPR